MELTELLQKRLSEVITITNALSVENSNDQEKHQRLIAEIKTSGDSEEVKSEDDDKLKIVKGLNAFMFLRLKEIETNIKIMNELYSLLMVTGVEIKIDDKHREFLDFNSKNFKPTFIIDKGEVVFFNKEVEELILNKLKEENSDNSEIIKNIKSMKDVKAT